MWASLSRSELLKLNMNDQFLRILARKYNLKYDQSDLIKNSTPAVAKTSHVKQSGVYSTQTSQNISDYNRPGSCSSISQHITSNINITPGTDKTICLKSTKYLLSNGWGNSTCPNKSTQEQSLDSTHDLFKMFGINGKELENDLSRIFRPLNEFLCLIDMSFKGQYKEENNLDFLLRLLVRMTEIFSTKYGPALESGTLIRCP